MIIKSGMALIPIAISPYGQFGPIIQRFLYGTRTLPHPPYQNKKKPNALPAAKQLVSRKVPQGILKRANKLWHREHKNEFYGTSYMAADPWSDVDQQLGLLTCLANGKHMMKYINTVRKRQLKLKKPVGSSTPSASTPVDAPIIDESITRQTPHVNPFVATDLYLNLSGISDGDEACDEENLSSSSDNLGAPALLA